MKKIRIMLMSLLVIGCVGAILSFKVKGLFGYCSTSNTRGGCTIFDENQLYEPATPQTGSIANKFCTDNISPSAPCISVTIEQ